MRAFVAATLVALAFTSIEAGAVDRAAEDEARASIELMQARAQIAARDYAAAELHLAAARARVPGDPDVHSLLGFCTRKLGRFDDSYAHYQRALRIDPQHLGAREYLGELYLQRGELEQARAQLAELERLCPAGCEERSELANAILAHGTVSAP